MCHGVNYRGVDTVRRFTSQTMPTVRPKRGPPLRSQGHCFSRPQVNRSRFFMRKLKQHRSQVVFLNCRGRAVALKMAPGRRSRNPPLGPPRSRCIAR